MKNPGRIVAAAMILSMLAISASALPLPAPRHIFFAVANDGGVKYDIDGATYGSGNNSTYYIKADGGGLNELHITTSADEPAGQVTNDTANSSDPSGVIWVTNTGGRGYDDNIILLLAVNGTIPDDFSFHVRSSGYTWTPAPVPNRLPTVFEYTTGAVDETFTKSDFLYGPQTWKPGPGPDLSTPTLPLYHGGNITDTANGYQLMFIDLRVGNLKPGAFPSYTLTDNGGAKLEFQFHNLRSHATLNAYGWCLSSNQGQGISWTNRVGYSPGQSGYSVMGVSPPAVVPLPGFTNPPTDTDGDGIYEDLNANGRLDFNDVQLFFRQMRWIAENEPFSAFDLNHNDRIDFNDIQLLFREIGNRAGNPGI